MTTDRTATTDPGATSGALAVRGASVDPLAELLDAHTPGTARDARPRAQRRTGTRAQRAEADQWHALMSELMHAEATEADPGPVVYVDPAGPDRLPPDHPARVLLARAEGPTGLYAHAERATAGATADDLPAEALADLPEHLRTPEVLHQCAAQHYRLNWRAGLDGVAARALALALLLTHLAQALTLDAAQAQTAGPAEALAETWPPPWRPPPAHLALTTSTLTAAPPAPVTPVLALRACSPTAA